MPSNNVLLMLPPVDLDLVFKRQWATKLASLIQLLPMRPHADMQCLHAMLLSLYCLCANTILRAVLFAIHRRWLHPMAKCSMVLMMDALLSPQQALKLVPLRLRAFLAMLKPQQQ